MTEKTGITRRKILASMGAVGAVGAGAGMGTSALFSDEEEFESNSLTAGTLDLQVDWEEHYSYPQLYGSDDPADGLDVTRSKPDEPSNYVGLPDPKDPVVWVHESDLDAYMDNTILESGDPQSNPDPGLIELSDVKPGDWGEVTFSYHLFDNPGYVRLEAEEVANDENGQNDPEQKVDDTTGSGNGELGEKVRAALWYDPDCDNVFDEDRSNLIDEGSLSDVIDGLEVRLNPAKSGGRVADGYLNTNCHGTGGPFGCSEKLYLTNTVDASGGSSNEPFGSPSDDTTKLYEVTISGGSAELTELTDLTGKADNNGDGAGDFNHVVSIAASPDGQTIYLIDKFSNRLGEYDVLNDTFTDQGEIIGAPDTSLQAAVSPAGKLYFTVFGESNLYVIDAPSSSTSVDQTIQLTDQNGDPIEVGGSDIAFLSNGTLYLFDGKDVGGTDDLYKLPDPSTGNAELVSELPSDVSLPGLSVRAAGDGNLIGVDSQNDELYELDPSDGSKETTYTITEPSSFDHQFGDMTVGALCPEHCVALAWWVPADVGNEIQSDTYEFDVTFRTEQCRNNDIPFS